MKELKQLDLGTYRLVDKDGWFANHIDNMGYFDDYFDESGCIVIDSWTFNVYGDIELDFSRFITLIGSDEYKFFECVDPEAVKQNKNKSLRAVVCDKLKVPCETTESTLINLLTDRMLDGKL